MRTQNEQPTANSQQPTANSQQPTANSQQPTANSQQNDILKISTFSNSPLPLNQLFQNDCISLMQSLPSETIDLIIADPPYFKTYSKADFDFNFENRQAYMDWSRRWLSEAKRIMKPTATLILWGGVGKYEMNLARLAIMIEDEDILYRQNWVTQRNSRGIGSTRNYMSAREDFLFLTKTKNDYTFNIPFSTEKSTRKDLGANGKPRKNTHKRISNVWIDITEASQSSIERCEHPTVKAQKLCDRIITTHSNENDIVFIPFSGSGSEIISCINNKRNYIASEIEPNYIKISLKRISNPKLNKHL